MRSLVALAFLAALASCSPTNPPHDVVSEPDVVVGRDANVETPFASGPYGTNVRDLAGPFTVPTQSGDWSFADAWTGRDSYLFLVYAPGALRLGTSDYSADLFGGSLAELLEASPRNVHYFILWQRDEPGFTAVRDAFPRELDALASESDRVYWSQRVHFVPTRADMLPNWIGTMLRARTTTMLPYKRYDALQFGIDRTQRIREVGQLGRLTSNGLATELPLLAKEAHYYNFEKDREAALAMHPGPIVTLADKRTVHDAFEVDVDLPSATALEAFDTLEVDLSTACANHRDGECGAWDYLSHLWLCRPADMTPVGDAGVDGVDGGELDASDAGGSQWVCDREVARWITTYWREGRWVTDISGMLAVLKAGGRTHFRWWASPQFDPRSTDYVVSLSLRFSNRARGMRPVEAVPLWQGGDWNAGYDAAHAAMQVNVPAGLRKVELYTLVTGHGGVPQTNCAEFCNHEHRFAVNSNDHVINFPESQTSDGCADRVGEGVVPNQHGTWYYGRGGWCPGFDVAPRTFDVTANVNPGAWNELRYTTRFRGAPVSASLGNIVLSSYLIYWR